MSDLRRTHYAEIRDRLQGRRQIVHDRLRIHSPCTGSELARAMGWPVTSLRPRLCELQHLGLANATGNRRNGEHVFAYVSLARAEEMARMAAERPVTANQLAFSI